MTITDNTTGLGLTDGTYAPVRPSLAARVATVGGADNDEFIRQIDRRQRGHRLRAERRAGRRAAALGQDRQRRRPAAPSAGTSSTCPTARRPARSRCGPMSASTTPSAPTARSRPPIETTNLTGLVINGVDRRRRPARARRQRRDAVRRRQRHGVGQQPEPERLRRGRVRLGRDQRQRPRRRVLQQRPADRPGAGDDGELQRRQPAQAPRRRRVRGDLGIRRADLLGRRRASSARRSNPPTPTSRRSSPS